MYQPRETRATLRMLELLGQCVRNLDTEILAGPISTIVPELNYDAFRDQ